VDALEGAISHGLAHALCDPAQGWREHGLFEPGFQHLEADRRRLPHPVKIPAVSTIHAMLDWNGLGVHPKRRRPRAVLPPADAGNPGVAPGPLWDFRASQS